MLSLWYREQQLSTLSPVSGCFSRLYAAGVHLRVGWGGRHAALRFSPRTRRIANENVDMLKMSMLLFSAHFL
jgi:hypothetical protein